MNATDLRKKNNEELQAELIASLQEQFNLRLQKGVGQAAKSHLTQEVKKRIARIKTILREREGS